MVNRVKVAEIRIQDLNTRAEGNAAVQISDADKFIPIIPSFVFIGISALICIVLALYLFYKILQQIDFVKRSSDKIQTLYLSVPGASSLASSPQYSLKSIESNQKLNLASSKFQLDIYTKPAVDRPDVCFKIHSYSTASFKLETTVKTVALAIVQRGVPSMDLESAQFKSDPNPGNDGNAKSQQLLAQYSPGPREIAVYGLLALSFALLGYQYGIMYSSNGYTIKSDESISWYSRYIMFGVITSTVMAAIASVTLGTVFHYIPFTVALLNGLTYALLSAAAASIPGSQTVFIVPAAVAYVILAAVTTFYFVDIVLENSKIRMWLPANSRVVTGISFVLQVAYLVLAFVGSDIYKSLTPTATYWVLPALETALLVYYGAVLIAVVEYLETELANAVLRLCGVPESITIAGCDTKMSKQTSDSLGTPSKSPVALLFSGRRDLQAAKDSVAQMTNSLQPKTDLPQPNPISMRARNTQKLPERDNSPPAPAVSSTDAKSMQSAIERIRLRTAQSANG